MPRPSSRWLPGRRSRPLENGVVTEIADLAKAAAEPGIVEVDGVPRTREDLKDARQKPYMPEPLHAGTH